MYRENTSFPEVQRMCRVLAHAGYGFVLSRSEMPIVKCCMYSLPQPRPRDGLESIKLTLVVVLYYDFSEALLAAMGQEASRRSLKVEPSETDCARVGPQSMHGAYSVWF